MRLPTSAKLRQKAASRSAVTNRAYPRMQSGMAMSSISLILPSHGTNRRSSSSSHQGLIQSAGSCGPSPTAFSRTLCQRSLSGDSSSTASGQSLLQPVEDQGYPAENQGFAATACQQDPLRRSVTEDTSFPTSFRSQPLPVVSPILTAAVPAQTLLQPVAYQETSLASTSGNYNLASPQFLLQPVAYQEAPRVSTSGVDNQPAPQTLLQPVAYQEAPRVSTSGIDNQPAPQTLLQPVAYQGAPPMTTKHNLPPLQTTHLCKSKADSKPSFDARSKLLPMQSPQTPSGEGLGGSNGGQHDKTDWRSWVLAPRVPSMFEPGEEPKLIPSPKKDFEFNMETKRDSTSTLSIESPETPGAQQPTAVGPSELYYLPATTYDPTKVTPAKSESNNAASPQKPTYEDIFTASPRKKTRSGATEFARALRESKAALDIVWTNKPVTCVRKQESEAAMTPSRTRPTRCSTAAAKATAGGELRLKTLAPSYKLKAVAEKTEASAPVKTKPLQHGKLSLDLKLKPLSGAPRTWEIVQDGTATTNISQETQDSVGSVGRDGSAWTNSKLYLSSSTFPEQRTLVGSSRQSRRVRLNKACLHVCLDKQLPPLPTDEESGEYMWPNQPATLREAATLESTKPTRKHGNTGGGGLKKSWKVSDEGRELIKQALGLSDRPNLGSWMQRRVAQVARYEQ